MPLSFLSQSISQPLQINFPFLSLVMPRLPGICASMLMPLPATFSVLAISMITLPFSIYYLKEDILSKGRYYFWTQRIKLPKCKNCQLWKVLKEHQLLSLLKVRTFFLFKALGAEFQLQTWEWWLHISTRSEGKVSALQGRKKVLRGEQQQRTSNCNYILNAPLFCYCDLKIK